MSTILVKITMILVNKFDIWSKLKSCLLVKNIEDTFRNFKNFGRNLIDFSPDLKDFGLNLKADFSQNIKYFGVISQILIQISWISV